MVETHMSSDVGLTHEVRACGGPEASRAALPGPLLQAGGWGLWE